MQDLILRRLPPTKRPWPLPDVQEYELLKPFPVHTCYGTVTIPKGFVTDFASAELLKWLLVGSDEAALVHDYFYREPNLRSFNGTYITKEISDEIFESLLAKAGFSWLRRNACLFAVYFLGAGSWVK